MPTRKRWVHWIEPNTPRLMHQVFQIIDDKNLSLRQAAESAGIDFKTLHYWASGTEPHLYKFENLINSLGYELLIRRRKRNG